MRRAAVPIAFLASYTLIAPFGVAVMSSASVPASPPPVGRPALRLTAIAPSPERALQRIAGARAGTQAARKLMARSASEPQAPTQTIVSGSSAWGIARQYGVPVDSPAEVNRLSPNSVLRTLSAKIDRPRVSIPPADTQADREPLARPAKAAVKPQVAETKPARVASAPKDAVATVAHIVAPGETLWRIATAYGARVEDVMARNGLREDDVLKPGQRLVIVTRPAPRQRETAAAPLRRQAERDAPALEPGKVGAPKGAKPPAQVGADGTFLWPTRGIITSRFGWRRYRRHHGGVDLASPHGTPIFATRDGVVTYSGWRNGYGQVVYIDHEAGLTTIYGHASELLVAAGKKVKRGEMIARVGCTGWCTGAHLHFEVRINDISVNPLQYLR